MFDKLRQAFNEAVDNFWDELNRDEIPEAVDRLSRRMRDELAEAKVYLDRLAGEIERTGLLAGKEAKEVETCLRRQKLAEDIDDEETATVAAEFARKHEERRRVLEEKVEVLKSELELRTREFEEMKGKLKEAIQRRDSLAAQAGRSSARRSVEGAGDLFDEMDRMAERMGDSQRAAEAIDDLLDDELSGHDGDGDAGVAGDGELDADLERMRREADLDARLEEIKRRMGKE